MPTELTSLIDSLRRGFDEIPPIAIALALLAGPTLALIGYRLVAAARRLPVSPEPEAAPFWVCHDCRSINELRLSRCYRCGLGRDTVEEIEVIVDQPAVRPTTFEAPAGSPFAALGGMVEEAGSGPGVPVMAGAEEPDRVAVGPGHTTGVRLASASGPASSPDDLATAEPRA